MAFLSEPARPAAEPDSLAGPAIILPEPCNEQLFYNIRRPCGGPARPVCCIAIDAEEDFDWTRPGFATGHTTACMRRVVDLREIFAAYCLRPTYLLTYPVLEDVDVVRMLRRQYERGECEMGVQLHPWVTPPFDEPASQATYLGNLDPVYQERKLVTLIGRFREAFGFDPVTFRAGRYGLSCSTTRLLEKFGFLVDTSLAPRTDFSGQGGPDFSDYDCEPFWFGEQRKLLELPLCRSLVGWSRGLAPILYRAALAPALQRLHGAAVLSRLRCAERVTLSPEGNDARAMRRFLRNRRRYGQRVFSLSFHSSSLAVGRNPYVRSKAELHVFYDRLSEILDTMSGWGLDFATLAEIPVLLGAST